MGELLYKCNTLLVQVTGAIGNVTAVVKNYLIHDYGDWFMLTGDDNVEARIPVTKMVRDDDGSYKYSDGNNTIHVAILA